MSLSKHVLEKYKRKKWVPPCSRCWGVEKRKGVACGGNLLSDEFDLKENGDFRMLDHP